MIACDGMAKSAAQRLTKRKAFIQVIFHAWPSFFNSMSECDAARHISERRFLSLFGAQYLRLLETCFKGCVCVCF